MLNKLTLLASLLISSVAFAAEETLPPQILFKNVNIFNGTDDRLYEKHQVLVEGNLIKAISAGEIKVKSHVTVIDGGGRTLMPGIIEGHGHIALPKGFNELRGEEDIHYLGALMTKTAQFYIDHGWTTVRDAGGPSYGIKKAIDEGSIVGPRIYTSGMFLSQTSGHGDFRRFADPHPNDVQVLPVFNRYYSHVVDGVPEVAQAAREELRKGAVHLKLMAGGGLSSDYDPIHTTQFFEEEINAAVRAAADWGTYVMVHAYTDEAVQRAIKAGVKSVEHGHLLSEKTIKMIAENDVWLSIQINFGDPSPEAAELIKTGFGLAAYQKWLPVRDNTAEVVRLAKKHDVKIVFGSDSWGASLTRAPQELVIRANYYSNFEVLKQATSQNAQLLKLTGPLNPYKEGDLGVVEKGAYADLIIVDGNPLKDIKVMTEADNIKLVMKGGNIYKNILK